MNLTKQPTHLCDNFNIILDTGVTLQIDLEIRCWLQNVVV